MNEHDIEIIIGCDAAHPDRRGGQHVAKHCTAVLVIHKPTGIGVRVDSERSQHGNRMRAMQLLGRMVYASTLVDGECGHTLLRCDCVH